MKATFSRGDKPEKNAARSTGDVGSWKNTNIEYDKMYSTKYGYCDIMKKGMAFKCHSPIIVRPGAGSWVAY